MYRRFLLAGLFVIASFSVSARAFADTGFVANPLWLNPATPADGQTVKLTALFHNGETQTLSGTVVFYDGSVLLGQKKLSISADGVGIASTSFTVTAGSHAFSASMTSVSEINQNGVLVPYTTPIATAHLSKVVVSAAPVSSEAATAGTAASAAELTATGSSADPLLQKVSGYETSAIAAVPPSIQASITTAVQAVDTWRANTAATFQTSKAAAKAATQPLGVDSKTGTLSKNVSPSTQVDGPIAYIELALFTILSFIFSFPVIFYVLGIILAYVIIRFIVRKIVAFARNRRESSYRNSFPKAPKY